MALNDNTDPSKVGDRILSQQLDGMAQRGELQFTNWAGVKPATGWNIQAFQAQLQSRTPVVPPFEGAAGAMPWLKLAKDDIGGAEGNEPFAYHGALSPERAAGKFRVGEGDNVDSHEVSVGMGFNMTQPGARQFYSAALGDSAPSFDDVLRGRKAIEPRQAVALQEYMILQKNATLQRQLEGTPLKDHQRAALVSMLYQGVDTKPVVAAIKAGSPDSKVADLIRSTGPQRFRPRRDHEASRYLGAAASAYFDNSTNQIPGRTAP